MKTHKKLARDMIHLLNEKDVELDEYHDPLKLAHALTGEQQALDELISATSQLIRLMMDEQLHETSMVAAERVNIALKKVAT